MQQNEKPSWFRMAQRRPLSVPPDAPRPMPLLFDREHRPIQSRAGWQKRKNEFRKDWLAFLGEIPGPRPDNAIKVIEQDRLSGVLRQLVSYQTEPGLVVEGYLLRPDVPGRGRPGVVVLHATTAATIRQPAGLDDHPSLHIGLHMAERGYVAFAPRCFLWQYAAPGRLGAAVDWLHARHPKTSGMAKMFYDASRAVDILAAQSDVDARRIAAIGHSLGAKEALYLAAFDERVRATVASEPGISLRFSNWDAPWYLGDEIKKPAFGLDHAQVLAQCAPRAFLLIGGNSADGDLSWPYIAEAMPVWKIAGNAEGVGLFNHRGGHAFPPTAQAHADEWLDWFLQA
jgi:dienelactone hydrolase